MNQYKMPDNEIRILTSDEYYEMHITKSVVHNREEHQSMKLRLLQNVKKAYGDKWNRLKPETRKAIDRLAWFAADKGYAFPHDDTLADTYNISPRTVRSAIKTLRDAGLVYVVYFRAKKGNGRRGHVLLFTEHPLFERWATFLQLRFLSDCQQDDDENTGGSKGDGLNRSATVNLTDLKHEKHTIKKVRKYIEWKIMESSKDITYLSAYIDRIIHNEYLNAIYDKTYRELKREYHDRLRKTPNKAPTIKRPDYDWLALG
jgi:DNA-binding transcriptional ArsR family regulator